MKDIIKLSLALGLVCTVAAAALACAYSSTSTAIEKTREQRQGANLERVLPPYGNTPMKDTVDVDGLVFYLARSADSPEVIAVAGQAAAKGFGGPVQILVGLNLDGSVRKILVTKHTETPGLGTQVTDRQQRRSIFDLIKGTPTDATANTVPPNPFLDQFEDFSFDGKIEFTVGKNISPVSGATISSKAVNNAIIKLAATFASNKERILQQPEGKY